MTTDITERKRAEEALRESEARARAILNTAFTLQGVLEPDGTLIEVNAAALAMIDVRQEDVAGRPFWDCPWWTHNPDLQVQLRRAVKRAGDGETVQFLATHPTPAGIERIIDFRIAPVTDENGEVALLVPEGRDITDLKRAEAELRQAKEQAETALAELTKTQQQLVVSEKMASLGQLTAGIAHEIKNPLNFVNNFSETSVELLDELKEVLESVRDQFDEDNRDDLDDILTALRDDMQKINYHGRRADSIVKSMLLHARGNSADRVPTSVNDLVEEAFNLTFHGERARDKGFYSETARHFDDSAGEAVLVPQEIMRVLINLFSNAFYAVSQRAGSEEASGVAYRPLVEATTKDLGDKIQIRVRDNGTGIPESAKTQLFDPFFTTKPTNEGTGLGLSMSYDIVVHQHHGQINVESEPRSFTEFVIELPRAHV